MTTKHTPPSPTEVLTEAASSEPASVWEGAVSTVPWERQPGESSADYALFSAFLLEKDDKISGFCVRRQLSPARINGTAARWRWKARRLCLEHHLTRVRTEAAEETARKQGQLHAAAWGLCLDWAMESMLHAMANGQLLASKDILPYLKAAFEAQRLMRGESTVNLGIGLARASTEHLDRLDEVLAEIERAHENPPEPLELSGETEGGEGAAG